MTAKKGQPKKLSPKEMKDTVDALLKGGSVSGAAKILGMTRQSVQNRLDAARDAGLAEPRAQSNVSRWRPFEEIVTARKGEFSRVKGAGDGRKVHPIPLADDGPFCVVALGDPHLDSPGTDLNLWERWTAILDADQHVHGFPLGDWLDNWPRFLAFLYGRAETPAPEAWILLEGYLDRHAKDFIASVSGNHDDWSGYTDLLGHMMRERGVLHRHVSLRVALTTPSGRKVTIGARHRFSGNSQWNPAHAVMKAAQMGWRDTILIGGDKHISGDGLVRCPDTGRLTWCYQVAAFKILDEYGDELGLPDKHVSPAVAFVIEPIREDSDPQLVTPFHDPGAAVEYLRFLRAKA